MSWTPYKLFTVNPNTIYCTYAGQLHYYWSNQYQCSMCACVSEYGRLKPVCASCAGCMRPVPSPSTPGPWLPPPPPPPPPTLPTPPPTLPTPLPESQGNLFNSFFFVWAVGFFFLLKLWKTKLKIDVGYFWMYCTSEKKVLSGSQSAHSLLLSGHKEMHRQVNLTNIWKRNHSRDQ